MTKRTNTSEIKIPKSINSLNEYKEFVSEVNNSDKLYLFRGQSNVNWPLCSSWIRQHTKEEKKDNKDAMKLTKILRKNIIIFEEYLPKEGDRLENLAYLQHTKDIETPLIDFTDDINIATWFALAGQVNPSENAVLFLLKSVKPDRIKTKIKDFNEKDHTYQCPNVSKRAIAQRSYFLLDNQEWEENENISKIEISKFAIKKIVDYLVNKNKTHKSVFPDLKGTFLDNVNNSAATYFLEALKTDNNKEKIILFSKSIELNPNKAVSHFNRGMIYAKREKYKEATEDLNKAIELNPNDADAYNNRGVVYLELGKYQETIEDSNKATEYFNKAIEDLNKAIELDPNVAGFYYNRGKIYQIQGNNDKAIEDFNKAIELDPNDADAYYNRGEIYQIQGNNDKATEDFNKAIELDPNYVDAYNNRGVVYLELGKYQETIEDSNKATEYFNKAIEDFNKAIELDPNYAFAYYNRGKIYQIQGNNDKAIEDFNKAIELDPNVAGFYYNRGMVYAKLEKHKEAIEDCEKFLSLYKKEDKWYKYAKALIKECKNKLKTNS